MELPSSEHSDRFSIHVRRIPLKAQHPFDLDDLSPEEVDLFAEELPSGQQQHGIPPNSLSTFSCASCTGPACLTTFYSYGCV
jgi:hypothetical protein